MKGLPYRQAVARALLARIEVQGAAASSAAAATSPHLEEEAAAPSAEEEAAAHNLHLTLTLPVTPTLSLT